MSKKTFALNTKPHEIVIGDTELLLEPEVLGSEFAEAYAELKVTQKRVKDAGEDLQPEDLKAVNSAMRSFISRFMLPDSKPVFDAMRLPDRVLIQVLEYTAELYGGGSGNDDGGSSGES